MCNFNISLLFYFILCFKCNYGEIDQKSWVDPHDMSPVYDKEYFPYDINVDVHKNIDKNYDCDKNMDESKSNAYLRRIINMILNSVYEDSINDNNFKGHLIFEIEIEKFKKLHEFANDRFDNLHEIDDILSEILKKPSHDYVKEYFLNWFAKIFKMISSRSGIFGVLILCYIFVIYKMLKGNLNYWAIFKFLFVNVVIFDFAFVWIRLYQKAQIDKLAISMKYKDAPDYCNPKTMTSMQYIRSLLSTVDQCKEYHQVTLTDIFWTVSPGDVLTEMITKTITEPMKAIGPAIGHFIYGIYGTLPFGVNIILLPLVLVFVMIMSCITLSFLLKIPIKFNFFHLFSFSFGDNAHQTNGNILTGHSVEKLLEIVNNTPRFIEGHQPSISENDPIVREIVKKIERQISQNSIRSIENKMQTDETEDRNIALRERNIDRKHQNINFRKGKINLEEQNFDNDQNIDLGFQNIDIKEQSNEIKERNIDTNAQKLNFEPGMSHNAQKIELEKISGQEMLNEDQNINTKNPNIDMDAQKLIFEPEIRLEGKNIEMEKQDIKIKEQNIEINAQKLNFEPESEPKIHNDEFLSNIKSILESPRSDSVNFDHKNRSKKGFEPNVTDFETSDDNIRKRKGNDGAGDF